MAADETTVRERLPRRGRYLIPKATPRRAEAVAACATAIVIAHLLFAQLTIVLAVIFHGVTRATRWRPQWLLAPALAGAAWAVAIGPGRAVSGLLDGPRQVAAYLGGVGGDPARVLHLSVAMRGMGGWLPRQLPLALITGAAEAALAAWLSWLHTDEWRLPPARPGLIVAVRRLLTTHAVRAGGVVTADGGCLGVSVPTGTRATVSWSEAAGGVLCAGSPGSGTTTTSFQLVHAAIRRRKPVIAVDLAGDPSVAGWFAAVCAATNTPLHLFGPSGRGYYEPLRGGDPGRRAALITGMINWGGIADQYRRSCGSYLNDLFAVLDAAPGDPRTPVIDEVLHLLNPAALRARAEHVPPYHPHRRAIADRIKVSASLMESDSQTGAVLAGALAGQLTELRASAIGRWLRPVRHTAGADGRPPEGIDLSRVVRDRAVVLFSLDRAAHGPAAATIASLVAQDVVAICAELRGIGVDGDGLVWFDECGAVPAAVLTDLVERGSSSGLPAVLATTSMQPADRLADQVSAVVIHRITDPVTAERFARLTGEKLTPGEPGAGQVMTTGPAAGPAVSGRNGPGAADGTTFVRRPMVSPEAVCTLADGEFVLAVKGPRRRLLPLGRTIPARLSAPPPALTPGQAPPLGPGQAPPLSPGSPPAGGTSVRRRPREPFGIGQDQPRLAGALHRDNPRETPLPPVRTQPPEQRR
jgi:hypothetical protein